MRSFLSGLAFTATLATSFTPAWMLAQGTAADSGARPAGELPLKPTKPLRFTTDEGTWLALDVSPSGRTIVFDLLGDLYTLPMEGGKATRITSGQAFDGQPHWSPDGGAIVFTSDRSGSENLWLVKPDGSGARALTREQGRAFISPTWTPDGRYVVVSRSGTTPGYNLYLYHRDGGTGLQLTGTAVPAAPTAQGGGAPTGPSNYVGAAFGKNPRYVYSAVRTAPGGGYNQTSLDWQIGVYDRETGKTFVRTDEVGSGMRPVLSPDGRWLVYATRRDSLTAVRLRDLATGDERVLAPNVQRDDQESRYSRDLVPPFSFTPDSKAIVVAHHGKIWRIDVPDGRQTMIPFTADVDQMIAGAIKLEFPLDDSMLVVRQIRNTTRSPDGRQLAFSALDKLWTLDLDGCATAPANVTPASHCTPRRVTASQGVGEFTPAWSPDGRWLAYVTWSEQGGGDVYRVRMDGRRVGAPERLSTQSGFYDKLAWSRDGQRLVVARGPRQQRRDRDELGGASADAAGVELVWMPAAGGAATVITPVTRYGQPHFGPDSNRVYLYEPPDGLVSMRWDGTDRKAHLRIGSTTPPGGGAPAPGADEILISPDGERAIVQLGSNVYLVGSVPMIGANAPQISLVDPARSAVPVRRLTRVGGDFARWSADGRDVLYSLGRSFFTYDMARADSLVRDSTARADSVKSARGGDSTARPRTAAGASRAAYEPQRLDVSIRVPKDRPTGTVVLRGARIISMKGDEVIASGDVVVRDNRIAAVGATGSVAVPNGARVIDVAGKTILPGYVDVHAHMWPAFGVHRSQPWEYLINLAYGVTTTRDPQTSTTDVLTYGDLVEAGDVIGPRLLATGPGVFARDSIRSQDDARDVLRRYSEFYQTQTIKQYMAGDRRVRQWVIIAAREQGLLPTLEGGLDFKKNLTEAMDGYSGIEHTLPIAPQYKDAVQLFAQSGTTWTPTLVVQYGGPWAENYWYENTNVVDDPKVNRFMPRHVIEEKTLRRPGWWSPSAYSFPLFAAQAARIVAAGGRVGLGSHGQFQGLGAHWEIWSIASGGMPRHDVLRVSTIFGAEAIGLGKQLGSIEPGKLADLQVLDANPLDDIRNTNTVRYVMKNGRMYDAATMNEMWPRQKAAPALWWWGDK
ncbi:MAG TPA: amidohydrolase family protein [Gemmatimonadaceae bacterium]|nr:amidohydrolase family protein [Gemmatimonadaceae bacterium]